MFGRDLYNFVFTTRSVIAVHQGSGLSFLHFSRMSMISISVIGPLCYVVREIICDRFITRLDACGGQPRTNERGRDVAMGFVQPMFLSRSNDYVLQKAGRHGNRK